MRRASVVRALGCGVGCVGIAPSAHAETLFSFSGQVAQADGLAPDGVKVKLQVDLDRNGRLDSFETLSGSVAKDGSHTLSYDLNPKDIDLEFLKLVSQVVTDYLARGFDSLLDDGLLPVILSFEREGYSTVVTRHARIVERAVALLGVAVGRQKPPKWAMMRRHDSCPVRAAGTLAPPSSSSPC